MFKVKSVSTRLRKIPVANPVKTSFATMLHRYALTVLIEDTDGHIGIGESWVNFPFHAAYEREAAFRVVYGPALEGKEVVDVATFSADFYKSVLGPAIQSGTLGILLPAMCAMELCLWDIEGQIKQQSLAQLWFDNPIDSVQVYASGINSPLPTDLIERHLDAGVTLFKLKLGFGDDVDKENLEQLAKQLDGRAEFALDVNRKWTMDEAIKWLPRLHGYKPKWLEEPLCPADEPQLRALELQADFPLSWGENVMMPYGFDAQSWIDESVHFLQPDLTKYTPPSVALDVLAKAETDDTEARVIPHFLGSAPGQAASLHYAAGCKSGLCEIDINNNELRTAMCLPAFEIKDARISLPQTGGLGYQLQAD